MVTCRPVVVRGVAIGAGRTKTIVPLTGRTAVELCDQAEALPAECVDVVEWRADHFSTVADVGSVVDCAGELFRRLPGTPLLFTCRSAAEGGAAALSDEEYAALLVAAVTSGCVDLVDVELARLPSVGDRVLGAAHRRGVAVVMSSHDMTATPARDQIVATLREMERRGADISKVAVHPSSPADVLTLLDATRVVVEEYAERPIITISMGQLGMVSRVAGGVFGSAATFGMAGGRSSAPGQIDVRELAAVLRLVAAESA